MDGGEGGLAWREKEVVMVRETSPMPGCAPVPSEVRGPRQMLPRSSGDPSHDSRGDSNSLGVCFELQSSIFAHNAQEGEREERDSRAKARARQAVCGPYLCSLGRRWGYLPRLRPVSSPFSILPFQIFQVFVVSDR